MTIRVRLTISNEYSSAEAEIQISDHVWQDAAQPIVFASATADTIIKAFICTPPDLIKIIKKERDELTQEVARLLLDQISNKDTKMGYAQ